MILNQNNRQENGNELAHHHHQSNSNKKNQLAQIYIPFFEDHKGIILKKPTQVDITIKKTYYADVLVNKLYPEIKKQWRDLISAGVIHHHHNAPTHTSFLASSTIPDLKYELLRHPPFSPVLASSDYFFVSRFKRLSQRKTLQ